MVPHIREGCLDPSPQVQSKEIGARIGDSLLRYSCRYGRNADGVAALKATAPSSAAAAMNRRPRR